MQDKTAPGDVVMMMDASDVLFTGGSQQILDAYQALDAPIVASVSGRQLLSAGLYYGPLSALRRPGQHRSDWSDR